VKDYPETIEHAWDVLYRDYPEIYDAFSAILHDPRWIDVVTRTFPLAGKDIVDVGCGTGESSLALAEHAAHVVGVEPESAMLALAVEALAARQVSNVTFVNGSADMIPLANDSVDVVTAITAPLDPTEALRVLKLNGLILRLDIAPDWYGGDLNRIIDHPTPDITEKSRELIEDWGFSFLDYDCVQDYGSTAEIVRTYGFIFGRNAIRHLKHTGQTSIRWRFRIHYYLKEDQNRSRLP
jgi:ubiquinone/menaquinone biosynthesis C-methylase UbiE